MKPLSERKLSADRIIADLRGKLSRIPGATLFLQAVQDVRVGGRYRMVMHAPDGEVHRVGGVFREVIPNKKLVYTWAWESTPERESLVTVEFKPSGHETELVLTHRRFFDTQARDRHQQGWNGSLDRLGRFLSR